MKLCDADFEELFPDMFEPVEHPMSELFPTFLMSASLPLFPLLATPGPRQLMAEPSFEHER